MGDPAASDPRGGSGSGSQPGPRHNSCWPAAPPWHETREEFEARVAEYDRRETILARHNIHVVYREVNTGFQLRIDGRLGIWVVDRQTAYVCDERGVPVRFDQASYAIEYAWEHLLSPEARVPSGSGVQGDDGERPAWPGSDPYSGSSQPTAGDGS